MLRRGGVAVFDRLSPRRTAHVVVDLQNGSMMMNYKVFFITDACATMTDAEQGGTLSAMAYNFCDVRDTQSVMGLIAAV